MNYKENLRWEICLTTASQCFMERISYGYSQRYIWWLTLKRNVKYYMQEKHFGNEVKIVASVSFSKTTFFRPLKFSHILKYMFHALKELTSYFFSSGINLFPHNICVTDLFNSHQFNVIYLESILTAAKVDCDGTHVKRNKWFEKWVCICKIWGFHGGDYEEWCLLGCYAVCLL
jgi:hypothetical protein